MGKDNEKDLGGRPAMSQEELMEIVHKLEPYLRAGLSLRKAILQYNSDNINKDSISHATAYKYYGLNPEFTDKIDAEKNYLSVLTSNVFYNELIKIAQKQKEKRELTKEETKTLKWFASNSKSTRREFGSRSEIDLGNKDGEPLQISTPGIDEWFDNLIKRKAKELNEKQGGIQKDS